MVKMMLPKVKRVPKLGIIDDVIEKMAKSDACLLRYKEHISRKLCNHLRRTPDHPAYAFMIHRAIAELKKSEGPSEEEISDFISEEYKNEMLSVAHASMVKFHLIKLCDKGEILCTTENRYVFPWVKKRKCGRQSISRHESEKDNQSREELNLEHMDQQNLENQNRLHEEQVTAVHEGNKELNICVFEEHPLAKVCQPNTLELPVWSEEREVVERQKINKEECDETRGHHEISAREVTEENHVVAVQIREEIKESDERPFEQSEVIGKERDDRVRQSKVLEKHADLMEEQNRDLYSSNVPLESFNDKDKYLETENQVDLEKSAKAVVGATDQRQRIEIADIGDEVTLQAEAAKKNRTLEVPESKEIEGNCLNGIEYAEDVGKESKDRVKKGNVLENRVEVMEELYHDQNSANEALGSFHEKDIVWEIENQLHSEKLTGEMVGVNEQQQTKESENVGDEVVRQEAENNRYLKVSVGKEIEVSGLNGIEQVDDVGKQSKNRLQGSKVLEYQVEVTKEQNQDHNSATEVFSSFHAKYTIWESENQLHSDKPIGEMVGANDQQQTKESKNAGDDNLVLQEAEVTQENQDLVAPMSEETKENDQNVIQRGEVFERIVELEGQNTSSQALGSLHEKQAHCDSEKQLPFEKAVSEASGANDQQQTKESENIINELMLPEAEVIEQLNPKYTNALHLSANRLLELESEANMTDLPNMSPESQPSEEAIQAITSMKGIFTGMLSRTKEMQQSLENMVEFFTVFNGSKNSSQPMTGEMASGHLLKLFDSVDMLRKQCELPSLKRALETTETCHKLEQKLKRQKRNPFEQCDKQFSQEPESKEQQEKSSDVRSAVVSEEPYIKNLEQMKGGKRLEMQIQTASNSSASKPHCVSQRQLRPRIDGVVLPYPYLDKNIIASTLISLSPRRGRPPMFLMTNIEEASPSNLNETETADHFEAKASPLDKDCNNIENEQLKEKKRRGRPRKSPATANGLQMFEHSSGPNDTEMQDHGADDVKSKVPCSNDHNHIGNGQKKKRKPGPGRPRKRRRKENAEQIMAHPIYLCSGADKKSGRGRGRPPKSRLVEEATIAGYCTANFCPG